MTKVTFFTVCGGGEDYEFLLGAIEHHSKMGSTWPEKLKLWKEQGKRPLEAFV